MHTNVQLVDSRIKAVRNLLQLTHYQSEPGGSFIKSNGDERIQYSMGSRHHEIFNSSIFSLFLQLNGASFTKLFFYRAIKSATENDQIFQNKLNDKPYWSSNLSHADMPFDLKRTVPSLRYLRTDLVRLKNVEDHIFKQFPNLRYLRLCRGTSEKVMKLSSSICIVL